MDEAFALLADNPRIGRRRSELMPEMRSFTVGRYVIFYGLADDGVEIIGVIHGARDIENTAVLSGHQRLLDGAVASKRFGRDAHIHRSLLEVLEQTRYNAGASWMFGHGTP